ncbi:MAG: hypothetical protein AABX23_04570 [Nanoarchaeota archaeon]
MIYNQEKIAEFIRLTTEDYSRSLVIEDIATVRTTEKTDGSFIQIGIRPVIEDDIFIDPSFHPSLPSAGMMVAMGERDFLIQTIIDNKQIKKIEVKEDITEFPKYIESNNSYILLSNKFYVEVFTKLMRRIDYEERVPRLDYGNRIIIVPEKVLDNKIIIIGKNAIIWERELFGNGTLDILIKPAKEIGKVDITIRSVNKIKYLDTDSILVLEVKDGKA